MIVTRRNVCGKYLILLLLSFTYLYFMKPTELNMNPLEDNNTEIERKKVEIVESTDKKLPKAVIIGVKKCGTGALIEMLKMHPQVAAPSYYETEVKFWGFDDLYNQGLEYYKVSCLQY